MASVAQYWDGDESTAYSGEAKNWRLVDGTAGAVPLITDTVWFPDGCTNAVIGSDQSAVMLGSFNIKPGYTGTVGSETEGYATRLQIAATTFSLAGSGVTYLELTKHTDTDSTCTVTAAAASPGTGQYGLHLTSGTSAISTLSIDLDSGQSVGVAALPGLTGEFATISVGGDGDVTLGSGLTCDTLNVSGGGNVYVKASIAAINVTSGSPKVYIEDAVAVSTLLLVQAGTVYENSTGTIKILSIFSDGTVDMTDGPAARVITDTNVYGDGNLDDSGKHATFTNPIKVYGSGTNIDLGANLTLDRGTI